jgi:hypothetical protein
MSRSHPERVMHLVFDCPDAYDLPSIVSVTKESANLPKMCVSAVGTINHSTSTWDYLFFLDQYSKNPNLILTCFYLHILDHFRKNPAHPSILWLQADNCFKENKNRWMLAFTSWLVHLGWFNEVMISMLPPGHTHIDVDQMFSTLSLHMDTHSVEFITDLIDKLDLAYKKESTKLSGLFLPVVFDWISFFAPFLKDISGMNSAHVFLIRRLSTGEVGLKVKKWHSTEDSWVGSLNDPAEWAEVMTDFPEGHPVTILPTTIQDLVTTDVIKKYNPWMSNSGMKSWQQFLQTKALPNMVYWSLPEDLWNFKKVFLSFFTFLMLRISVFSFFVSNLNLFLFIS